jgi:Helix-turn-helix domain
MAESGGSLMIDSNQLMLPFAEKEYISVKRTASILGVAYTTVFELHRDGRLEMVDYRRLATKRVRYSSVIKLCDDLRITFNIRDRRPTLENSMFRHKDEDLLPFPISDTMTAEEAAEILGFETTKSVVQMIREGLFDAYQMSKFSLWRISRSSLAAYLDKVHRRAPQRSYWAS